MSVSDDVPPYAPARQWAVLLIVVAAGVGALIAIQGRLNADLARSGVGVAWSSWMSYVGTFAAIVIYLAARRRVQATVRILYDHGRWWWFAIGLCGMPIVYAMSWGVPVIGVALVTVCSVAGQSVSGTILDARGVGLAEPLRISTPRVLAGLCAVAGLSITVVFGHVGTATTALGVAAAALASFSAGFILSGQQAGNGRVAATAGDPVTAGLASVTGGLVGATGIAVLVEAVGPAAQTRWPEIVQDWPLYLGGPLGAVITVGSAWAVQRLGTFVLTLTIVGGQMVSAVVVDTLGGVALHGSTVLAIIAMGASVLLAIGTRKRTVQAAVSSPEHEASHHTTIPN